MRDPHLAIVGGLIGIDEVVLAHDHSGQGAGGHFEVVDDAQPLQSERPGELAAELVFVAGGFVRREDLVEVAVRFRPSRFLTVQGDGELGAASFDLQPAADEDVGLRMVQMISPVWPSSAVKPSAPDFTFSTLSAPSVQFLLEKSGRYSHRPLQTQSGYRFRPVPLRLYRVAMAPTPDDGFVGTQDHVHGRVGAAIAVAGDLAVVNEPRSLRFSGAAVLGHEDSLGVRAFHEVVVAGDVLFAGDGFVVAEEIDALAGRRRADSSGRRNTPERCNAPMSSRGQPA